MASQKLGVAVLGCGLFSKSTQIPTLRGIEHVRVVALYSRRREAALECVELFPKEEGVEVYHGAVGEAHDASLTRLLQRTDVQVVVVVLPVAVQPDVVRMALAAGKHVLSEKPIAPDWSAGAALVNDYHHHHRHKGLMWSVAENYRYEPAFDRAEALVGGLGVLHLVELRVHSPLPRDNAYANTAWRRTPEYIGSFLLDGGVHFIACLRKVCAVATEIKDVQAMVGTFNPDVPPPDTAVAGVRWGNGLLGTIAMTYAVKQRLFQLTISGENGKVIVTRESREGTLGYSVQHMPCEGEGGTEFFPFSGVELEVRGFLNAIATRTPDRNTPMQALRDLEIIHAILQSSSNGERVACDVPLPTSQE